MHKEFCNLLAIASPRGDRLDRREAVFSALWAALTGDLEQIGLLDKVIRNKLMHMTLVTPPSVRTAL